MSEEMFNVLKAYTEKRCSACGKYKPFHAFSFDNSAMVDSLRTICNECAEIAQGAIIIAHFSPQGRTANLKVMSSNRSYRKLKYEAERKFFAAKEQGLIEPIETKTCLICRQQAFHWHHSDYSKPLDVVPLCRRCHSWGHNGLLPKHILREHFPGVLPRYR